MEHSGQLDLFTASMNSLSRISRLLVAALLLLLAGPGSASPVAAQSLGLREPGLTWPIARLAGEAATPIQQADALRRDRLLMMLGVPTIAVSAGALAIWAREGRPEVVADDYHCGGYATPAVMAPLGALALGATVYAITHT